jgi:hypothetical protein
MFSTIIKAQRNKQASILFMLHPNNCKKRLAGGKNLRDYAKICEVSTPQIHSPLELKIPFFPLQEWAKNPTQNPVARCSRPNGISRLCWWPPRHPYLASNGGTAPVGVSEADPDAEEREGREEQEGDVYGLTMLHRRRHRRSACSEGFLADTVRRDEEEWNVPR